MRKFFLMVAALAVVAGVAYASLAPSAAPVEATASAVPDQAEVQALIADRQIESLLGEYESAIADVRQAVLRLQDLSDQVNAIPYSDVMVPMFDPMYIGLSNFEDLAFGVRTARADVGEAIKAKSPAVVAAADSQLATNDPCAETQLTDTANSCINLRN